MFTVSTAVTDDEKSLLARLRYDVFVLEQYKYKSTADHSNRKLWDALDEVAVHLLARHGNAEELVGSLRLVLGRQHATPQMWDRFGLQNFPGFSDEMFGFSGRLMLPRNERGSKGLLYLLQKNYEIGRESGAIFDFIMCNPHLLRLYERLGYRQCGRHFFDNDHGYNIPMVLIADDMDYFEKIKSPFLACARRWDSDIARAVQVQRQLSKSVEASELAPMCHLLKIDGTCISTLLTDFSDQEREDFCSNASQLLIEAGATIVRKGDLGEELYLITSGVAEARVTDSKTGEDRTLMQLSSGDFFGELSVFSGNARSFDIVATSKLQVLFIDRVTLRKFIKGKPTLAAKLIFNIAKVMAERLEAVSVCA